MGLIRGAGFEDVELVWTMDVFKGASGEVNASAFDTVGANLRGRKPF
jgi:hypothetical protein|tara:strand:- start:206 stop:346 length:141 start_codon:yes stop_codon:yes gene_type:complete